MTGLKRLLERVFFYNVHLNYLNRIEVKKKIMKFHFAPMTGYEGLIWTGEVTSWIKAVRSVLGVLSLAWITLCLSNSSADLLSGVLLILFLCKETEVGRFKKLDQGQ